jgi:hypothetical protein
MQAAAKSKCIFFRSCNMQRCASSHGAPFVKGGKDNEFVNKWSHLGHIINDRLDDDDVDDDDDVYNRKNVMIGQNNNLLCCFYNTDSSTKIRLFYSYCCSHYGCEIWDLNCSKISEYCSSWRGALRRLWDLPFDFRSDFLPILTG